MKQKNSQTRAEKPGIFADKARKEKNIKTSLRVVNSTIIYHHPIVYSFTFRSQVYFGVLYTHWLLEMPFVFRLLMDFVFKWLRTRSMVEVRASV